MKLLLDTHTHTIASGHAYSTISEMIAAAKEKNLSLLGITEHGPDMPGTCHVMHFMNTKVIPRNYDGLEVLFGAEANIMDYDGSIDFKPDIIACMDYMVASLHTPCIKPGTSLENTKAYLGVMKQPKVCIIGHPDDGRYPIDYKELVMAAKEYHVLLEVNNSSLSPNSFRSNARENVLKMLSLCKEYEVPVILNSDAHINKDVGNFTYSKPLLEEVNFPEHLVANTSVELFKSFLPH